MYTTWAAVLNYYLQTQGAAESLWIVIQHWREFCIGVKTLLMYIYFITLNLGYWYILTEKIGRKRVAVLNQIYRHSLNINFLCIFFINYYQRFNDN